MTIHEKLERLTRFMNQKAICKAAGLGGGALANLRRRKGGVKNKTIVALAKVLGVDPGWLIDDSKRWPPVRVEDSEACYAA